MRSFIEFGIVAGIVAVVAAALNGCAQKQASFAPVASQNRGADHRASQVDSSDDRAGRLGRTDSRAMLAGYQTAQSEGSQQSTTAENDRSMRSTQGETSADLQPESPRRRSTIDVDTNGPEQPQPIDEDKDNRGSRTRRSRRPYTSPSFAETFAQSALASATSPGTVFNPQLGREAAEGSLISAPNVSGERGLAASQPTARQTTSGQRGLIQPVGLASFNAASPNNIFTAQSSPRSGVNGACAELSRNGFGNTQICGSNVNRNISGRSFRLTIGRGIRR